MTSDQTLPVTVPLPPACGMVLLGLPEELAVKPSPQACSLASAQHWVVGVIKMLLQLQPPQNQAYECLAAA